MDAYAAIERRYGFAMPEFYRTLEARGHFGMPWDNYLELYDCEWLPFDAIANYEFNSWEIASDGGFVPFAITGAHEPYCWRLDWAAGGEPPIVLCERSESARCLAPDFRAFLYRLTLEALGGRNNLPHDPALQKINYAVDVLAPLLPAQWGNRLRELKARPWQKDEKLGNICVLPMAECDAIIAADLAFPHLNESFYHDKEYLKRLRTRG